MKTSSSDLNSPKKKKVFGDPEYGPDEDIYSQEEKETFDDEELPEDQLQRRIPPQDEGLDVPGAELDDADEIIGEEDEENEYYSLGGDAHNDLEEDKDQ
jgi:hypothetical protein